MAIGVCGKNPSMYEYVSPDLKENEELIRVAISSTKDYYHLFSLEYAGPGLRDNDDIVDLAVRKDGSNLEYASDRLRDQEYMVTRARADGLKYASDRLLTSVAFAKEYLSEQSGLQHFSEKIRDNDDVVDIACSKNASEILGATKRHWTPERIYPVIEQNGHLFKDMPEHIRDNKAIATVAIRDFWGMYDHVSLRLKRDPDILHTRRISDPTGPYYIPNRACQRLNQASCLAYVYDVGGC